MLITTIVGTAQNGTVSGVNLTAHVRCLEGRTIRVIIEEIAKPGEPGKEQYDQKDPQ